MSSWKEDMTAQKSQAREPVSIHGRCDTERCSKEKQITQMALATLVGKAYIFLQKKHYTILSVGEKSGWIHCCVLVTDICCKTI